MVVAPPSTDAGQGLNKVADLKAALLSPPGPVTPTRAHTPSIPNNS